MLKNTEENIMLKNKIQNYKKGFSLIELLVVVAIISILAGISIVSYTKISEQSKRNAVKPTLIYIYNLFRQHYIRNGHYGDVKITDISAPSSHCGIIILSPKGCKKVIPNHIRGDCRNHPSLSGAKINSGFMAIAYGKKQNLNVSIDHEKKFLEEKNWRSFLNNKNCQGYNKRKDCRQSGCVWDGTSCKKHPDCII